MVGTILGAIAALSVVNPLQAPGIIDQYLTPGDQAQHVSEPVKRDPEDVGIKTNAKADFVADLATGKVLYAKDPNTAYPIASLSKLVTAMTYLDLHPDLNRLITFTDADFPPGDPSPFKPGDILTSHDVLQAMLVGSVNSAAYALARTSIGEQNFVEAMNEKTENLGLWTPMFFEPSGLDPNNEASAADIAAILSFASGYPEIRAADALTTLDLTTLDPAKREVKIDSTNLLLDSFLNKKPYAVVAAKTGTLPQAGYCLAQITKNDNGHEVVAVELGSDTHFDRFQDIKALTSWSFDAYEWK